MTRIPLLALALLLQLPPTAAPPNATAPFRYRRSVTPPGPGQTCVVLDAAIFAHAQPFLKDLRLTVSDAAGTRDLPFVVTLSEPQQAESEAARILNAGVRGRSITFDLAMPPRPYTEVHLDLAAHNFLATATVTGTFSLGAPHGVNLGTFNLFDLAAQHLSRNTDLHLQESTFPFLHIALTVAPSGSGGNTPPATPKMILGATVPPSREAQTLFTVAAQTSTVQQEGQQSIARVDLPRRVPIERVAFTLSPDFHANFSRDVHVSTRTVDKEAAESPDGTADSVNGTITRVRLTRAGHDLNDTELSMPATLGANLQSPANVEIAVQNGDDTPLPITAVQLLMRQRALCFQALADQHFTLLYGNPTLPAAVYDLARTYTPSAHSTTARLGPEQLNPDWTPEPDSRPYAERHPHLLWIAMLLVVCVLALVAFRSSDPHHPRHRQPPTP